MQSLFKEYEGVFSENEEISEKKPKPQREYAYNPFALQDAIGEKNIKKIWIEYNKLILQGIESEDLIHKIVSKVRDMSAISKGAKAADLFIKDYTYSQSRRHIKNWKETDFKNFYTKLVSIYHQSRMGGENLGLALEKTLLSL